ncbi:MarR family winged helix-turn-helix transcriptional regulator [Euzebya sp.]|uniref:MarR family winged helix-turn-helix transcriptional regulator n=1 Tax=Euzebya sp. TaxID=1971409 RepID=UPI003514B8C3
MADDVDEVVAAWGARHPDWDLRGMAVLGRISRLELLAEVRRAAAIRDTGLSTADVDVLASLWRHPEGLRPRDLRSTMMIGSGTLTPRLDRLEAEGLLSRAPDPEDRRGRVLTLTPRGRQLAPEVVRRLLDVENGLLEAVPGEVRARLAEDLRTLLVAVEVDRADADGG